MEVEAGSRLPGWSKTGKRTRATRDLAAENLPPKKRKLDLCSGRKQHTCNICCRSFSSYQALGGHKAHHSTGEAPAAGDDGGACAAAVHQCTFCYKVFSKGQALGGHRRHCRRPVDEKQAKMVSFDLNELPPECQTVDSSNLKTVDS